MCIHRDKELDGEGEKTKILVVPPLDAICCILQLVAISMPLALDQGRPNKAVYGSSQ